jgi:hypothetical protein
LQSRVGKSIWDVTKWTRSTWMSWGYVDRFNVFNFELWANLAQTGIYLCISTKWFDLQESAWTWVDSEQEQTANFLSRYSKSQSKYKGNWDVRSR